jgi:hypothetical protein
VRDGLAEAAGYARCAISVRIVEVMVTESGTKCEIIRDAFPLPEPYIY